MTTNRLKKAEQPEYQDTRSALEWARSARERGNHKAELLWLAEAKRRGEIPDHSEPQR